jgi:hypothetical protein
MKAVEYVSKLLRSDPDVFAAIYRFNNSMLDYLHPDFVPEALKVVGLRPLLESPRVRGQALAYLRQLLGIDNLGNYNFSEPRYFLCLLSAEEIHRIICYLGGVCFSEQIRKIILASELLTLKQTMGFDAYQFTLRSASIFIKESMAESFRAEGKNLVERVLNTGKLVIEMSLAGVPKEILERFRLKFAKNFGWNFSPRVENPQYYFEFIKKVARRAIPDSNHVIAAMVKA